MSDCSICCESFTKASRKQISCPFCHSDVCSACHKRYLLDSIQEPHCMSCKKAWSVQFMNQSFTKQFLTKEYREKREIIYLKQEETHFVELLPFAERQKKLDRFDDLLAKKKKQIQKNDENEDQLVRDQRRIHATLTEKYQKILQKRNEVAGKGLVLQKKHVVMKCPLGECKGFLDEEFYCGMCNSDVCKDCHADKEEKHACDPNEVATVAELLRSTKPCPKCHTRIFKTDGCDQMFCIQCHTAFSWNTGREETGVIHNPHYFQALREGRIQHERHQAHQGGCGVMRSYYEIHSIARGNPMMIRIDHHFQRMVHHRSVTMNRFTRIPDYSEERIKYMIGKIDETRYKHKLYVNKKREYRMREEQQILTTYVNTGEELFRMMSRENVEEIVSQLEELERLTKEALVHIDTQYPYAGHLNEKEI